VGLEYTIRAVTCVLG